MNVFLYYTEGDPLRNRIYKYQWNGETLISPQLIVDLPAGPGTNHQGGKLKLGPDNQLYVIVGEMQKRGTTQNIQNGPPPDDTGVIFRVIQEMDPRVQVIHSQVTQPIRVNIMPMVYATVLEWISILLLAIYGIQRMDLMI